MLNSSSNQWSSLFSSLNPCSKSSGLKINGSEIEDKLVDACIQYAWNKKLNFCPAIVETFHIIIGNHYRSDTSSYYSKGLLDFLIFPLIARKINFEINNKFYTDINELGQDYENNDSGRALIPVILVIIFLEVPRLVIGVALTILAIPFIAIAHCFRNCLQSSPISTCDSEDRCQNSL